MVVIGNNAITLDTRSLVTTGTIHYSIAEEITDLSTKAVVTVYRTYAGQTTPEVIELTARIAANGNTDALENLELSVAGMDSTWNVNGFYAITPTLNVIDGYTMRILSTANNLVFDGGDDTIYLSGDDAGLEITGDTPDPTTFDIEIRDLNGNTDIRTFWKAVEVSSPIDISAVTIDLTSDILGSGSGTFNFTGATGGVPPYNYVWTTPPVPDLLTAATYDTRYNYPSGEGYPITITGNTDSTVDYTISAHPGFWNTTAYLYVAITDSVGNINFKGFEVTELNDYAVSITAADVVLVGTLPDKVIGDADFQFTGYYEPIVRNGISTGNIPFFLKATSNCSVNGETNFLELSATVPSTISMDVLPPAYQGNYSIVVYPSVGGFIEVGTDTLTAVYGQAFNSTYITIIDDPVNSVTKSFLPPVNTPIQWSSTHQSASEYEVLVNEEDTFGLIASAVTTRPSYDALDDIPLLTKPRIVYPYESPAGVEMPWCVGPSGRLLIGELPVKAFATDPSSQLYTVGGDGAFELYLSEVTIHLSWDGNIQSWKYALTDTGLNAANRGPWIYFGGLPQNNTVVTVRISADYKRSDDSLATFSPAGDRMNTANNFSFSVFSNNDFEFLSVTGTTDYANEKYVGEEWLYLNSSNGSPVTLTTLNAMHDSVDVGFEFYRKDAPTRLPSDLEFNYMHTFDKIYPQLMNAGAVNDIIALRFLKASGTAASVPNNEYTPVVNIDYDTLSTRTSSNGRWDVNISDVITWDVGDVYHGNAVVFNAYALASNWVRQVGWLDFTESKATGTTFSITNADGDELYTTGIKNEYTGDPVWWNILGNAPLGENLLFFTFGVPGNIQRGTIKANVIAGGTTTSSSSSGTSSGVTGPLTISYTVDGNLSEETGRSGTFRIQHVSSNYYIDDLRVTVMSTGGTRPWNFNNEIGVAHSFNTSTGITDYIYGSAASSVGTGIVTFRISAVSTGEYLDFTLSTNTEQEN